MAPDRDPRRSGHRRPIRLRRAIGATGAIGGLVVAASVTAWFVAGGGGGERARSASSTSATTDSPSPDVFELDDRPAGVVVAGDDVWVAFDDADVVGRYDASGRPVGEPISVPEAPVAMDEGGGWVWVVSILGTAVTPIDVVTGRAGEPLPVPESPVGSAWDDGVLWVASVVSDTLTPVDGSSGDVGEPIRVPGGAVRAVAAPTGVWVANLEDTVSRIQRSTGVADEPVVVGQTPLGLAAHDGVVWVAVSGEGTVARLDASTGHPIGEAVEVGGVPLDVVVVGDELWVLDESEHAIHTLGADGRVEPTKIRLDGQPRAIAAGAGAVWVTTVNPSTLVRIPVPASR